MSITPPSNIKAKIHRHYYETCVNVHVSGCKFSSIEDWNYNTHLLKNHTHAKDKTIITDCTNIHGRDFNR